jgi:uncharacterized protein (UPF0335 family)
MKSRGLPVGPSALKKKSARAQRLAGVRKDIANAIKDVASQKGMRLREDAEVFLFMALYSMVFLPAELAKKVEQLEIWRANLRSDIGHILEAVKLSGVDHGEITASSIVHGTSRSYNTLAVSSGWLG